MEKTDREPCPWRVVDDAGGAFVFGLAGGTIWHLVGGARNAPSGQRIAQAISRTRARVPILGGSFAIWGVLFSCCDCTFTYIRKKEDPWNAIMSGAATGGILAARAGMKAAGKSALVGGVILAAIEGLNIVVTRVIMPAFEKKSADEAGMIDTLLPPVDPSRPRFTYAAKTGLSDPTRGNNSNSMSNPLGGFFGSTSPLHNEPAHASQPEIGHGGGTGGSQWDAPGFTTDHATKGSNTDEKKGTGSSWGLW